MKSAISLALVAAFSSMAQGLIFNKTAAYADGNYEKYKCITTEDVNDMFPECVRQCQRDANANDGCAYNDFACHCANYDVYAPVRPIPHRTRVRRMNEMLTTFSSARRGVCIPTQHRRQRYLHA